MTNVMKVNIILLSLFIFGLNSCGKSDYSGVDNVLIEIPAMAQGVFPINGEPCADIESISGEPLKVSVRFQWTSAEFANNYNLMVFESLNEIYNETFMSLEADVILDTGKTYTWTVTSKNSDGETGSDTNSFTTPGEPVGNYVPYAAVISVEFNTTTSDMDVSWIGNDEDGDTLTYNVSVIENNNLLIEFTNLTIDFLNSIPYTPTTSYTVEVVCKDKFGNFSIFSLIIPRQHQIRPIIF